MQAEPAPAAESPEMTPAACAARLAELFPALFGSPPKPIKLRIQTDIQERAPGQFTRKVLSAFLHRHTTSTSYLKALAAATERFDLDGAPAGELSAEHRDAAKAELTRRRAVHDERRAAERAKARAAEDEARRERAALLHAFETTTLTRTNFCALKGIAEAELDPILDRAWHEREEARARRAAAPQHHDSHHDSRHQPRGPRPPRR